jgi:3-hydroxybutyryl-CoA dehydrogenase
VPPVVRLLYPAVSSASTLTAMGGFLRALGVEVQQEPDPEVPVLMKNAVV